MKTALITGANAGLGLATATALAKRGFNLILLCRSEAKGRPAVEAVQRANPAVAVELVTADLTDLAAVRRAAETVKSRHARIDVLVNNAGYSPTKIEFVQDIEKSFFANHVGHFVLTMALLPLLEHHADEPARIIALSSSAYQGGKAERFFRRIERLSPLFAYCDGKLANLLFAQEAARRLAGQNIRAYSVHPGVVRTNFGSDMSGIGAIALRLLQPFMKTAEQGAETSVFLASAPAGRIGDANNGAYFADLKPRSVRHPDVTEAGAARLWTKTETVAG
jgi:retinol dehydrogenase 12